MVDPHEVYPPELRCEKLDGGQLAILEKTGLADAVLKHTALAQELSVVRQGRLVDRKPGLQRGILYADFVAAIRAAIPLDVVPNVKRDQAVTSVLSNSFGFGGQNACLVMSAEPA
mgnify:FL=1